MTTNWLTRYANNREETREALTMLSATELHNVYKQRARKLSTAKQRHLTVDMVIGTLHLALHRGSSFLGLSENYDDN